MNIEKLNDCLMAGILSSKVQLVLDDFWQKCADVSKKHQHIEGQTREDLLSMMVDDLHHLIFP